MRSIIITGARNQIGYFLLPRLQMSGFKIYAISRQAIVKSSTATWLQWDLSQDPLPKLNVTTLCHIAPLKLAVTLLQAQPQIKRVIAFSSTSRFSKIDSPLASERKVAAELAAGEQALIDYCNKNTIAWTILRPTLVYGCGLDKNIYLLARFIRHFKIFPLVYPATGLRQPVHADDLAKSCLQIIDNPSCYQQSYQLSGGETLNYRQMVERIFSALQQKTWIIPLPLVLFKGLYHLTGMLSILQRFQQQLNPAMLERMNQDLYFDHQTAIEDFDYQPRKFKLDDLSLGLKNI